MVTRTTILSTAHCLLSSLWFVAVSCAACWAPSVGNAAPRYSITLLDTLPIPPGEDPFGYDSYAYAINDQGVISGESTFSRSTAIGLTRPVMWDESSQAEELWDNQNFGGKGLGINEAGFIVGRYGSGSIPPLPGPGIPGGGGFIWNPATRDFQDLGDLGGARVEALGINNANQVAGSSEAPHVFDINGVPTVSPVPRAFIWDETGGMRDLGTLPGGVGSRGTAINNAGQVVGWSIMEDGTDRAFIWDEATGMQDLGAENSRAFGINDSGQVVVRLLGDGVSVRPGAFLWDPLSGIQILEGITPTGINNRAQIVGFTTSVSAEQSAVLWGQDSGARLLQELVPSSFGWRLQTANAINERGQIVGTAFNEVDGRFRGFLLTPIPEPSTLVIGSLGILLIASKQRQRKGLHHGLVSTSAKNEAESVELSRQG